MAAGEPRAAVRGTAVSTDLEADAEPGWIIGSFGPDQLLHGCARYRRR